MVQLRPGMIVHAKKLDLHSDNIVLGFSAPRGQKFSVLLLGWEDPKALSKISAEEFLRNAGWTFQEDNKEEKKQ